MLRILCVISVFASSSAFARGVCEADSSRYCLGVLQLGHQRLNQCLINHYEQLTEACQKSLPKDAQSRIQKQAPKKKADSARGEDAAAHH